MTNKSIQPTNVGSNDQLGLGPERESVEDALLIVESYGPWGADLNDAHRRQIVLADEVLRLRRIVATVGAALALAGCMDMVQPTDIAVAEELCAKRGGYAHAQRWERGAVLDVNCKDGTQLQVRLPKKA
jgi:hypothetical protein